MHEITFTIPNEVVKDVAIQVAAFLSVYYSTVHTRSLGGPIIVAILIGAFYSFSHWQVLVGAAVGGVLALLVSVMTNLQRAESSVSKVYYILIVPLLLFYVFPLFVEETEILAGAPLATVVIIQTAVFLNEYPTGAWVAVALVHVPVVTATIVAMCVLRLQWVTVGASAGLCLLATLFLRIFHNSKLVFPSR